MEDLFETPELIPANVKAVFDRYADESGNDSPSYQDLEEILKDVHVLGYTFDYYLDAEPFNLCSIIDKIKEETEAEFYLSTERNDEVLSISWDYAKNGTMRCWFPHPDSNTFRLAYINEQTDVDFTEVFNIDKNVIYLDDVIEAIQQFKLTHK